MKKRANNNGGIIKSYNSWSLRQQYNNLCEATFKKYFWINRDFIKEEELRSQIDLEFELCCRRYNPHRGIDFPGYIKNSLKWGVLKWITDMKQYHKSQFVMGELEDDDGNIDTILSTDKNELLSEHPQIFMKPNLKNLTEYDKQLISMVISGKTVKDIATELKLTEKDVENDINELADYLLQEVN